MIMAIAEGFDPSAGWAASLESQASQDSSAPRTTLQVGSIAYQILRVEATAISA